MNRREFFKLSTLFAAAMAIEASPLLRAAAAGLDALSNKAVLYLIRTSSGKWKVKASMFVDMAKQRLSKHKYDIDTFRVLEIVDWDAATERRNYLWKLHKADGRVPSFILDFPRIVARGKVLGKRRGAQWKQMCKDKDPRVMKHLKRINLLSQEYYKNNPEARISLMRSMKQGSDKWFEELRQDPDRYAMFHKAKGELFSKWSKANPGVMRACAVIAGTACMAAKRANPELWNAWVEQNRQHGKKNISKLHKWYELNPELGKASIKKASLAGCLAGTANRIQAIKDLYKALPNSFTRIQAIEFAKQNGLRSNSLNYFKDDFGLLSQSRVMLHKGKGGYTTIYTKLYDTIPKAHEIVDITRTPNSRTRK